LTPLERALRERIQAEGSMTLEAYMDACNTYYYATRDPLGASGDFTTAPEISQMFGELIGACLADCWSRAGGPQDVVYVELGPGRGTLAADALRVMRSAGLEPPVHFVETSPVLRRAQAGAVPRASWHDGLATLPDAPMLLVANEFFDALPVQQLVGGAERRVIVGPAGLALDRDGEVVEVSPAREAVAAGIGRRLVAKGGVALIVDYGHAKSSPGDTLQAVRGHAFAPLLHNPGEQDLTAHVDFEALANAARSGGSAVTPVVTQALWLERLGIGHRAQALARARPERAAEVEAARARLCERDQMGELFKVMAIHSPSWPAPAGFDG
jgi:SAM-dependent MidA family methyltransferase